MYADPMKSRLVIRLLLFMASGALCGLSIRLDHAKWILLGRAAFLTYQEHRFDQFLAQTETGTGLVVILAIFALGLGVLSEAIAYAGDRIIGQFFPTKSSGA
jgi:hypothetical protein